MLNKKLVKDIISFLNDEIDTIPYMEINMTRISNSSTTSSTTARACAIAIPEERRKRKTFSTPDVVNIWKSVYGEIFSGTCKLCENSNFELGERDKWEICHIVPFSRGGKDELWNLRPLCRKCNRSMASRSLQEYAFEMYPERYSEILRNLKLD